MPFQNVPVRLPFQNLPAKRCRFRGNGRPIRHIFDRFQNMPASSESSLKYNRYSVN